MRYKEGSVHGRFQPFHNGHLEYVLSAKEQCNYLWIGITQFDIKDLTKSPIEKHREIKVNNPLTYFERVEIITDVMIEIGLSPFDFCIHPFAIDNPQSMNNYLSPRIPIFTTIYDHWNKHKITLLKRNGYEVIVLFERDNKEIDGMRIRKMILEGDDSWKKLVPSSTIKYIEERMIRERLIKLSKNAP